MEFLNASEEKKIAVKSQLLLEKFKVYFKVRLTGASLMESFQLLCVALI